MNSNLTKMKKDLDELIKQSERLYYSLLLELDLLSADSKKTVKSKNFPSFKEEYETWYSEALQIINLVLPSRMSDFSILYKNSKRKEISYESYSISDFLIGLVTTRAGEIQVNLKDVVPKFKQQKNILKSVEKRFSSTLFDIKTIIQADLFDNELEAAKELKKKGFLRGAGAISGVVLERHLKLVCSNHEIKTTKRNPSISDFNDILKKKEIILVKTWRYIQHLGDLRNLCDHDKEIEPTKEDIEDLIKGVNKITKTLY